MIQINFDSLHLEVASDPTGLGLSPTRLPSSQLQMPNASSDSHLCFWLTGYRLELPTPPWVALICYSNHRTKRNILLPPLLVYYCERTKLRKSHVGEMHRVKYGGKVRSFHAIWAHHSSRISTCSATRKLSKSGPSGFLWRLHTYARLIKSLAIGDWFNLEPLFPAQR